MTKNNRLVYNLLAGEVTSYVRENSYVGGGGKY